MPWIVLLFQGESSMKNRIKYWIDFYFHFGFIGLYSLILPVYWKQDSRFKNNGIDILSIKDKDGAYFRGTFKQLMQFQNYFGH